MSATHLLDSNVLISLAISDHEHHDRAAAWATGAGQLALCPIVEGALVRFLLRIGEHRATANAVLTAMYATGRCEFWEDSLSLTAADLSHVVGHRQVTDAYLAALAASRGAKLATFDGALAAARPQAVTLIA